MANLAQKKYDVTIIGGGFYGCVLALYYKKHSNNVLLLEKEPELLTKASYNNQARVHNGYHYPRSYITALRSHANFSQFCKDYKKAIDDSYTMIYAIASINSKVSSQQFFKFCKQIGAPITPTSSNLKKIFNKNLIDDSFKVEEFVFNSKKIQTILTNQLKKAGVTIKLNCEVIKFSKSTDNNIFISLKKGNQIISKRVINCTYSQINTLFKSSNLPLLPIKYEATEMPLVVMPTELKKIGLTIMDGPFFSILPFPDKKMHSIHHVRYTPHLTWEGTAKDDIQTDKTNFIYMIKDIQRYIPLMQKSKYKESLYQIKAILKLNELNDGRPILYRKDYILKNLDVVLGGKIDNIYDIVEKIQTGQTP